MDPHTLALKAEREIMESLGVTRSQARDVLHGFSRDVSDRKNKEAELEKQRPPLPNAQIAITESKLGDSGAMPITPAQPPRNSGTTGAGSSSLQQFIMNRNGIDEYWTIPGNYDGPV